MMGYEAFIQENDEAIFAALCHIFARDLETVLVGKSEKEQYLHRDDAPGVMFICDPLDRNIEFVIAGGFSKFVLGGIADDSNKVCEDKICVQRGGLDYCYRAEQSTFPDEKDFDTEFFLINLDADSPEWDETYETMYADFEQREKAANEEFRAWWKLIQEAEVIARLSV